MRIKYAGDFHMDLVPRITENGHHYILNRIENEKEITDGERLQGMVQSAKSRITGRQPETGRPPAQVPQKSQADLQCGLDTADHTGR